MRTIICQHCGRELRRNKRLKHLQQRYCNEKSCQKARKRLFDRNKYHTDVSYRTKKLEASRNRLKGRADPGARSEYQRAYRASHPDYVHDNRKKQRVRNARRTGKLVPEAQIVNPDTLMLQYPDSESIYAMIPVEYEKIVNPDTLMLYQTGIEMITKTKPMYVRLL
jgi:hypothetical protein